MLIDKVQTSPAFGKTKVMQCNVKNSQTKKNSPATLYKLDCFNFSDIKDVISSKNASEILTSFLLDNQNGKSSSDYYVLCNDKNGEIVSCAQTEHRFNVSPENFGTYTLIEALGENKNYVNPVEPLIGYIVKKADDRYDNSVYAAYGFDEKPDLKRIKFSESKLGEAFIPSKRFNSIINKAQEHSSINFVG